MKRTLLILLAVVLGIRIGGELSAEAAEAAAAPPPSAPAKLGAAELEKLAMPIALHPDPLLATLLPASVYPLEIVQAARFVKDTNNIAKVDEQPWDDTVKAVAKIPALIAQLDADLEWTMQLGQAFLNQPKELMDTIQDLRAKANKAGTLRTTPQQVVVVTNVVVLQTNVTQVVSVTNQVVQVQSSSPEVVYVPSYPPTVYYPPPAYVYDPYAPLITFGVGMAMGAIIANNCDWHGGGVWCGGGDVNIDIDRNTTINRGDRTGAGGNRGSTTGAKAGQQKWQPNQSRLSSSGAPSASSQAARGYGSGTGSAGARPATGAAAGARPSTGAAAGARPSTGAASPAARPSAGASPASARPSSGNSYPGGGSGASANRASPSPSSTRSSGGSDSSAFGGVNSGSSSRDFSNRGSSSRSGSYGGGGGGGGGGRGGGGGGGGRRR